MWNWINLPWAHGTASTGTFNRIGTIGVWTGVVSAWCVTRITDTLSNSHPPSTFLCDCNPHLQMNKFLRPSLSHPLQSRIRNILLIKVSIQPFFNFLVTCWWYPLNELYLCQGMSGKYNNKCDNFAIIDVPAQYGQHWPFFSIVWFAREQRTCLREAVNLSILTHTALTCIHSPWVSTCEFCARRCSAHFMIFNWWQYYTIIWNINFKYNTLLKF